MRDLLSRRWKTSETHFPSEGHVAIERTATHYNWTHIPGRSYIFLLRVDRGVFHFHRTISGGCIRNHPHRMQPYSHPPRVTMSHVPHPEPSWFPVTRRTWRMTSVVKVCRVIPPRECIWVCAKENISRARN